MLATTWNRRNDFPEFNQWYSRSRWLLYCFVLGRSKQTKGHRFFSSKNVRKNLYVIRRSVRRKGVLFTMSVWKSGQNHTTAIWTRRTMSIRPLTPSRCSAKLIRLSLAETQKEAHCISTQEHNLPLEVSHRI